MQKLIIFAMLAVILFSVSYAANAQTTPTCNGLVATHLGTERNDVIIGTEFDDVIIGLGGQDYIKGMGGNDTICGGDGWDRILAGPGDDIIFTSIGDGDSVTGGDGNDICNVDTSASYRECEEIIFLEENTKIDVNITEDVVITISTDKLIYNLGEPIIISGFIDPILENIPVIVNIINSDDVSIKRFQFDIITLDGTFGATTREGEIVPTGDYTVRAIDSQDEVAESTFTVTSDPFVKMNVSDETPAIGERFSVSGDVTGVKNSSQKSVLIEVISPVGESLTEVRNTAHTSAFIPGAGGLYGVDIDLALDDFFKQSGDFTVQAFVVLNSDIESLEPSQIPKGNILAVDTIRILDFEPRTGTLDVGAPILRIEQSITLPDATAADTSNINHILRLPITNNQDLLLPQTTSIITIVTPDNPDGEISKQTNNPVDVGLVLQMDARFVPSTPGDYLFTFELRDVSDNAVITPVNHTVTVSGDTTNPEQTNQELSDEIVDLKARIAALESR